MLKEQMRLIIVLQVVVYEIHKLMIMIQNTEQKMVGFLNG